MQRIKKLTLKPVISPITSQEKVTYSSSNKKIATVSSSGVITGKKPISERAKEIWEYIAPRYGIVLEEWNHDIDHVHVMFRAQPKTELSKFINAYKSASSRLLKKEYPEIREKLWKEAFWSQSFCLLTAGGAPVEVIRQYIETQGEKKN